MPWLVHTIAMAVANHCTDDDDDDSVGDRNDDDDDDDDGDAASVSFAGIMIGLIVPAAQLASSSPSRDASPVDSR
jgi:hypothetical protein